jgi:hypothetical protein
MNGRSITIRHGRCRIVTADGHAEPFHAVLRRCVLFDPLAISRTGIPYCKPVSVSRICQSRMRNKVLFPGCDPGNLPRHCSRCVAGSKQVSDFFSGIPAQSPAGNRAADGCRGTWTGSTTGSGGTM